MAVCSKYVGVSRPLLRGKSCGWVAQKKSAGLYKARFATQELAAAWLAKELKLPLQSLRQVTLRK